MNPKKTFSYLWVEDLSTNDILKLFSRAQAIQLALQQGQTIETLRGHQVALFFSEASTRTKLSFQIAAQRLGAQCLVVDNIASSSMSKGETFADTFWTIHAMRPDALVVRCGEKDNLDQLAERTEVPVLNAGFGSLSHPTQALLDAYTLLQHFGDLKNRKIVFVGDIDHSRVAVSGSRLLKSLGAKVAFCGPEHFLKKEYDGVEIFHDLNKALQWCDVYVGLRVQFERHGSDTLSQLSKENYQASYRLDEMGLKKLKPDAVIMHPGPVNWGIEFHECVQSDPRLLMWKQKENGVYVRAALLEALIKVKKK